MVLKIEFFLKSVTLEYLMNINKIVSNSIDMIPISQLIYFYNSMEKIKSQ